MKDIPLCGVCVKAKQQKTYNHTPVTHTTHPFELIHSDLVGPISSPSWSGARYLILYIDDFTGWAYGYFLRSKESTEVTSGFQEFHTRIETAYPNWPITRFRCDNARSKYDNSLFRGILRVNGIAFEPSPPYSQSKNGVSERMIPTIITKARAMLFDSNLPNEMWAEVAETALYLHARSPSNALGGSLPYELMHSKKPDLFHLRCFGCLANRLLPKEQREGKFSTRSHECIMIGYTHDTGKIWRLWDPHFRCIVCSADVIFDESVLPSIPGHGPGLDFLRDFLPNTADAALLDDEDADNTLAHARAELILGQEKEPMRPDARKESVFMPVPPPNAVLSPAVCRPAPQVTADSITDPGLESPLDDQEESPCLLETNDSDPSENSPSPITMRVCCAHSTLRVEYTNCWFIRVEIRMEYKAGTKSVRRDLIFYGRAGKTGPLK